MMSRIQQRLRRPFLYTTTTRSHMNHGSGGDAKMRAAEGLVVGPRSPLAVGLEASEVTQHILRLLESSYLGFHSSMEGVWHNKGMTWVAIDKEWKAEDPKQAFSSQNHRRLQEPRLLSLQFSDSRTAMAHVKGLSGEETILSLLRLENQIGEVDNSAFYSGWRILRSVTQQEKKQPDSPMHVYADIEKCIAQYFAIEHGGGSVDEEKARALFHPSANLLTVGISSLDEPATAWTAPSGSLLEIPLNIYLQGVLTQTPHRNESLKHDEIVGVRVLPCQSVAAVALRVGNGSCNAVFDDHLLLGKQSGRWKILSKVFSTHKWS